MEASFFPKIITSSGAPIIGFCHIWIWLFWGNYIIDHKIYRLKYDRVDLVLGNGTEAGHQFAGQLPWMDCLRQNLEKMQTLLYLLTCPSYYPQKMEAYIGGI